MKKIILLVFLFFFVLLEAEATNQDGEWFSNKDLIKPDSMNLTILAVDFETYELNGANISYYPLCDKCDSDSLPFDINFKSPGDYGEILFRYTYNMDTLFYASIWWMGMGQIFYPKEIIPADSFKNTANQVALPDSAQYFDYWLVGDYCSSDQYIERADSAWAAVDSLDIVSEFAEYNFRVGFYAYTPAVGVFDPSSAKWIIFLYYGNDLTGVPNDKQDDAAFYLYPNPSDGTVNLANQKDYVGMRYEVANAYGQNVKKGRISNSPISLMNLSDGIYIVRIWDGERCISRKITLVK